MIKQVLTPEDMNFLEECLSKATPAPWGVVEDIEVDTAWVVPSVGSNPIALFDYKSGVQNKADAHFVASARNYAEIMINEIKALRNRVLELIQANNLEVQKRIAAQEELMRIKKFQNEDS